MSPQRIQLRRTAGWRKPEGVVVVSRPGKWGNPYAVGDVVAVLAGRDLCVTIAGTAVTVTQELAVALFRARLLASPALLQAARDELAGRDLACWCRPGEPCHGDVLLELVNQ